MRFLIGVTSPTTGKIVSRSTKRNGTDDEFEFNFLTICRYLNLVNNQRIIV